MATLGEMIVKIIGENSQFDSSIDKSENKLTKFQETASKVGGSLTKFVTLPLVGLGVAAVKSAADMEMQQAAFETMLGSAEKASKMLEELSQFAAKTPFQLPELTEASKLMLSFGISAEKILPNLKMLGDIAQGNSQKLSSLSLAFSQIQSTGRLMGQDLLQLINAGFNPLQVISEKTGKSMADLKKEMEKGAISADMVSAAFKIATSEGGRFFNGMEKASETFSGKMSTLMDNVGMLGRSLAEILLPALKNIVDTAIEWTQKFTALDDRQKDLILTIAGVAAAIGPLLIVVGGAIKTIGDLKKAIDLLGTATSGTIGLAILAIAALVTVTLAVADAFKKAKEQKENLDTVLKGGTTGSYEKDLETINKELETQIGKREELARFSKDERAFKAIDEEITKLKEVKVQLAEKLKWQGMNQRGQEEMNKQLTTETVAQEKINEALQIRTDVTKKYQDQYSKVTSILDSEKSEYEKIEDQIKEIGSAWAAGSEYEAQRLAAIEVLRKRQQDILDEEHDAIIDELEARKEAYAELTESQLTEIEKQKKAIYDQEQAYIAAGAGQAASHEWYIKEIAKIDKEYQDQKDKELEDQKQKQKELNDFIIGINKDMFSSLVSIATSYYDNQIALVDAELQSKLKAAGLADKTALESAKEQLRIATEKNDAEAISEANKAIAKAQIEEEYERKKYKLQKEAFEVEKKASLAQIAIDTAMGVAKVWAQSGINVILGGALSAALIAIGAAQASLVSSESFPPIQLAEGGLVMPKNGGVQATIAEAGIPELVIPLNRLGEVLSNINIPEVSGEQMIHITQNIDSKPILDLIFPATKNKQVLIDSGALVT